MSSNFSATRAYVQNLQKALKEAQDRIVELEAEVKALKSSPDKR